METEKPREQQIEEIKSKIREHWGRTEGKPTDTGDITGDFAESDELFDELEQLAGREEAEKFRQEMLEK